MEASHITDFGKLTKQGFTQLRADIVSALKGVEEKYNLKFSVGNAKHDYVYCELTLKASTISPSGETQTKQATNFKKYCDLFGLKAEDLNKMFAANGTTYKIIGLNAASTKYPVIVSDPKGKEYKFTAEGVRKALSLSTLK